MLPENQFSLGSIWININIPPLWVIFIRSRLGRILIINNLNIKPLFVKLINNLHDRAVSFLADLPGPEMPVEEIAHNYISGSDLLL